jgi:hypothetical protein
MKAKFTRTTVIKIVLITVFSATIFSCVKNFPFFGSANPVNVKPVYNLDVFLGSPTKNSLGSGFIEFRQNPDSVGIITLDTRVSNLVPNHSYVLERAVNPIADTTGCSSTAWLQLGKGLVAQSIHTDAGGYGEADLWRNVSTIAPGTAFHIHFQVIDSASLTPVLISDCYNYTVR